MTYTYYSLSRNTPLSFFRRSGTRKSVVVLVRVVVVLQIQRVVVVVFSRVARHLPGSRMAATTATTLSLLYTLVVFSFESSSSSSSSFDFRFHEHGVFPRFRVVLFQL